MSDADDQALMESLLECTGWPNTPSKARLRRSRDLHNLIPEGGENRGEATHFATCVQNARFGELGEEEFQIFKKPGSESLVYQLMADVAAEGDCSVAIGLAVSDGTSEGNRPLFGRLHRDPQWMGLQPLMGMLQGLESWIFPSDLYRDRPGSVVAGSPGSLKHRGEPGPFPPGEASLLKTLLEKHGAVPFWMRGYGAEESLEDLDETSPMAIVTLDQSQSWPHTPSRDRFLTAREEVNQLRKAGMPLGIQLEPESGAEIKMNDARCYLEDVALHIYHKEALQNFSAMMEKAASGNLIYVLQRIVRREDSKMNLGIGVIRPDPTGKHTHVTSFSRLSRDTDWMGLGGILLKVRGLVAVVHESERESGLPGWVLALSEDILRGSTYPTHHRFPEGQATWLKEVLEFHGATPYWVPDAAPAERPSEPFEWGGVLRGWDGRKISSA